MNLAKVALYLEYIAFNLRREVPMAKQATEPQKPETKSSGDFHQDGNWMNSDQRSATEAKAREAEKAAPEDEEDTGRRMDPELKAISAMLRQLAALDDTACGRVVRYLSARFPGADQR